MKSSSNIPYSTTISAEELGRGTDVQIELCPSAEDLYAAFARDLAALLETHKEDGRHLAVVFPVGPVDYSVVTRHLNEGRVDCRHLRMFVMDEYIDDMGALIPIEDRFSLRGYIQRSFIEGLDPQLRPVSTAVCPESNDLGAYTDAIREAGGIDVVFTGFGINGHWAFNEPPEDGEAITLEEYRSLPTRVVKLSRETLTQLAMGQTNGDFESLPRRAVTIGIRELLAAREIHGYFARSWHSGVVRQALHRTIEPSYPASLVRLHPRVTFRLSRQAAEPPQFIATQSLGTK